MVNFAIKNLEETLNAIFSLNNGFITVKKIRVRLKIEGSNRSKIKFISNSLKLLERSGFLERNGQKRPKSYNISFSRGETSIKDIISHILKEKR
ncbi:hypothetical protein LCGC14_2335190 [marine sediment metagenome]|uniref:ArnR1-like winged helix-turn-helix domain-containing protein n=1 Tax=marine sediment metagenome TaxID=412755 RepID=A0A0F9ERF8_9ZZZZ